MNICFIAIYPIVPSIGGVQRVTDTLAKEFIKRGNNVFFLAYSRKNMLKMGPFSAPQYFIEYCSDKPNDAKKELHHFLHQNNIDIIINQNFNNESFIRLVENKVKIITVCHTQPFPEQYSECLKNTTAKTISQMVLKYVGLTLPCLTKAYSIKNQKKTIVSAMNYSDKICFISDRFVERVGKYIKHVDKRKFAGINNPNTFNVGTNPQSKENIILWVGRVYNGGKNAIGFIKAWQKIHNKFPDWQAIMIGEGSDLSVNKEYAKNHGIDRLVFTGRINNISDYYERAKCIVVTSWSESWCMALPEGMAYGCVPFVYNTYESLQDIVSDGVDGFVIDPSEESLVDSLSRFIMNESDYCNMGKNSMGKVKRFSVEKIVDQWEQLINEVLYE